MDDVIKNPKVDAFIEAQGPWREEMMELRRITLGTGLTEELKWGVPCYTVNKKNVVLIHGFKEYCAMLFVKGSLLPDPQGVLVAQTENVQAGRQVRFTGREEILALEPVLKSYILEAAALEESGATVAFKPTAGFNVPEEFQARLDGDAALKEAFGRLTPGRQRGYLLHFGSPKQAKTREARIDKAVPSILAGKGLNDD